MYQLDVLSHSIVQFASVQNSPAEKNPLATCWTHSTFQHSSMFKEAVIANVMKGPGKMLSSTVKSISELRQNAWEFLCELEGDMKDWLAGVQPNVPGLITDTGFQVSQGDSSYLQSWSGRGA